MNRASAKYELIIHYGPKNLEEAVWLKRMFVSAASRAVLATNPDEINAYLNIVTECTRWIPACNGYTQAEVQRQMVSVPPVVLTKEQYLALGIQMQEMPYQHGKKTE